MNKKLTSALPFLSAIASGVALAFAFPPFNQTDAAWLAPVPLLLALRSSSFRRGAMLGFISGVSFWLINLAWLLRLSENGGGLPLALLGYFALSAWCSLFWMIFGSSVSGIWSFSCLNDKRWKVALLALVAEPLLWVGSEYLRGILFTGFPWNPLSASQYENIALLHCVSWAGSGTLSFLLIAVASGTGLMVWRIWCDAVIGRSKVSTSLRHRLFPWRTFELSLGLVAMFFCWMRGIASVREIDALSATSAQWRVGVVHPDLPCIFNKDVESANAAYRRLVSYTSLAGEALPDFGVWPETILPGSLPDDIDSRKLAAVGVSALRAPLIAGGVELELSREANGDCAEMVYNSALLFGSHGRIYARYRKRHLVPFGEFIPGASHFPFLARLAPAGINCSSGTDSSPLIIPNLHGDAEGTNDLHASLMICFEDAFPHIAREAARLGGEVFICIANDAWFDGSRQSEQHLAQAVLRSVENRRPMIRCANRGVSCVILPNGRVVRRIGEGDGGGNPGFFIQSFGVPLPQSSTLYSRYGDMLLHIPAVIFLTGVIFVSFPLSRKCFFKCRREAH